MPKHFVSRLMKTFLVNLMLLVLIYSLGLPAAAEEAVDPSNSRVEENGPIPGDPDKAVITDAPIKNGAAKQEITHLPIHAEKSGTVIRVHPPAIDVTLLGPPPEPKAGNALKKAVFAYIRVKGLAPGVYVRPTRMILPDGYVLIDAAPELFVVEITETKDTPP